MHHSPELKSLHGNHCNVKFVACMDSPLHSKFILSFGGTTNTRIHMAEKWNYVHANKSLNVCCHVTTASKASLTCITHGRTTELSHANLFKMKGFQSDSHAPQILNSNPNGRMVPLGLNLELFLRPLSSITPSCPLASMAHC